MNYVPFACFSLPANIVYHLWAADSIKLFTLQPWSTSPRPTCNKSGAPLEFILPEAYHRPYHHRHSIGCTSLSCCSHGMLHRQPPPHLRLPSSRHRGCHRPLLLPARPIRMQCRGFPSFQAIKAADSWAVKELVSRQHCFFEFRCLPLIGCKS